MKPAEQGGRVASPPTDLGRYRLEAWLGEGATGTVFRALHLDLKRHFALKILKPGAMRDGRSLARFRQEAEALGRLRHPHIVEVTDFGVDDKSGTPYLVLEYLEGGSLAERLPFSLERALPLLLAIAGAVDFAHEQGILHRDLKPANVFLTAKGVKILDFGLAELVEPHGRPRPRAVKGEGGFDAADLTVSGALPGTPHYVAPEVVRAGATSRASDLYSLGVLAYELLAGRPPFSGTPLQVLEGHLERTPASIPGLAPGVFEALLELLHKDPRRRPATARAAIRGLRTAARQAALERFRETETPRRRKWAALLAVCLLVAALELPGSSFPGLDRWFYDHAVQAVPARPPDPRLLLVTIDEESLAAQPAALSDLAWADELGRMIFGLRGAGASGVAVDLLMPQSWSASAPLADAVLRHAGFLTLAAQAHHQRFQGTDCLDPQVVTALGREKAAALFGLTNLDEDGDGTIRSQRIAYRFEDGGAVPSWPMLAARQLGVDRPSGAAFRIDHRIDWRRVPRISWHRLAALLERRPTTFAGRLVLVGGELAPQQDQHFVPGPDGRRTRITGLRLQSLMISSLVASPALREAPGRTGPLAAAFFASLGAAWFLCSRRRVTGILISLVFLAGCGGTALALYRFAGWIVPLSTPLAIGFLGAALALVVRFVLPPFPTGSLQ